VLPLLDALAQRLQPLALLGLGAAAVLAGGSRVLAGPATGRRAVQHRALRRHPARIVVESLGKLGHAAAVHQPERVGGRTQQGAVVRDEHQSPPRSPCSATLSAKRISRSRWLVGSSSSSRLGRR